VRTMGELKLKPNALRRRLPPTTIRKFGPARAVAETEGRLSSEAGIPTTASFKPQTPKREEILFQSLSSLSFGGSYLHFSHSRTLLAPILCLCNRSPSSPLQRSTHLPFSPMLQHVCIAGPFVFYFNPLIAQATTTRGRGQWKATEKPRVDLHWESVQLRT
jgi:hypothetical protein